MKKCEQCGFIVEALPEGGGEYLCPNCGWVMRKGAPAVPGDGKPSPTDTTSATHLKIAKTVNVGFGDFASVLAATDASKIVPTDTNRDLDRTRTASASTLKVEAPDDPDDDVLSPLEIYDEDDEFARIQADIAARQKALETRTAELDAREKYLNKKLDEIIAEKEFLRTGIEKSDKERAAYLKQKDALDAQRAAMEKEMAARQKSIETRAAELDRKNEVLVKTRAELEKLKRELDSSMTGEQPIGDGSSSSISIPYSAKLLRRNSSLERSVRILKRVLICLGILLLILIVLLCDLIGKNERLTSELTQMKRTQEAGPTELPAPAEAASPETNNLPAPEQAQPPGDGL